MEIELKDLKKGMVVSHSRYGNCTVSKVYKPIAKFNGGVLLDNLSKEAVAQLNKDRYLYRMVKDHSPQIKKVFEDNLQNIVVL